MSKRRATANSDAAKPTGSSTVDLDGEYGFNHGVVNGVAAPAPVPANPTTVAAGGASALAALGVVVPGMKPTKKRDNPDDVDTDISKKRDLEADAAAADEDEDATADDTMGGDADEPAPAAAPAPAIVNPASVLAALAHQAAVNPDLEPEAEPTAADTDLDLAQASNGNGVVPTNTKPTGSSTRRSTKNKSATAAATAAATKTAAAEDVAVTTAIDKLESGKLVTSCKLPGPTDDAELEQLTRLFQLGAGVYGGTLKLNPGTEIQHLDTAIRDQLAFKPDQLAKLLKLEIESVIATGSMPMCSSPVTEYLTPTRLARAKEGATETMLARIAAIETGISAENAPKARLLQAIHLALNCSLVTPAVIREFVTIIPDGWKPALHTYVTQMTSGLEFALGQLVGLSVSKKTGAELLREQLIELMYITVPVAGICLADSASQVPKTMRGDAFTTLAQSVVGFNAVPFAIGDVTAAMVSESMKSFVGTCNDADSLLSVLQLAAEAVLDKQNINFDTYVLSSNALTGLLIHCHGSTMALVRALVRIASTIYHSNMTTIIPDLELAAGGEEEPVAGAGAGYADDQIRPESVIEFLVSAAGFWSVSLSQPDVFSTMRFRSLYSSLSNMGGSGIAKPGTASAGGVWETLNLPHLRALRRSKDMPDDTSSEFFKSLPLSTQLDGAPKSGGVNNASPLAEGVFMKGFKLGELQYSHSQDLCRLLDNDEILPCVEPSTAAPDLLRATELVLPGPRVTAKLKTSAMFSWIQDSPRIQSGAIPGTYTQPVTRVGDTVYNILNARALAGMAYICTRSLMVYHPHVHVAEGQPGFTDTQLTAQQLMLDGTKTSERTLANDAATFMVMPVNNPASLVAGLGLKPSADLDLDMKTQQQVMAALILLFHTKTEKDTMGSGATKFVITPAFYELRAQLAQQAMAMGNALSPHARRVLKLMTVAKVAVEEVLASINSQQLTGSIREGALDSGVDKLLAEWVFALDKAAAADALTYSCKIVPPSAFISYTTTKAGKLVLTSTTLPSPALLDTENVIMPITPAPLSTLATAVADSTIPSGVLAVKSSLGPYLLIQGTDRKPTSGAGVLSKFYQDESGRLEHSVAALQAAAAALFDGKAGITNTDTNTKLERMLKTVAQFCQIRSSTGDGLALPVQRTSDGQVMVSRGDRVPLMEMKLGLSLYTNPLAVLYYVLSPRLVPADRHDAGYHRWMVDLCSNTMSMMGFAKVERDVGFAPKLSVVMEKMTRPDRKSDPVSTMSPEELAVIARKTVITQKDLERVIASFSPGIEAEEMKLRAPAFSGASGADGTSPASSMAELAQQLLQAPAEDQKAFVEMEARQRACIVAAVNKLESLRFELLQQGRPFTATGAAPAGEGNPADDCPTLKMELSDLMDGEEVNGEDEEPKPSTFEKRVAALEAEIADKSASQESIARIEKQIEQLHAFKEAAEDHAEMFEKMQVSALENRAKLPLTIPNFTALTSIMYQLKDQKHQRFVNHHGDELFNAGEERVYTNVFTVTQPGIVGADGKFTPAPSSVLGETYDPIAALVTLVQLLNTLNVSADMGEDGVPTKPRLPSILAPLQSWIDSVSLSMTGSVGLGNCNWAPDKLGMTDRSFQAGISLVQEVTETVLHCTKSTQCVTPTVMASHLQDVFPGVGLNKLFIPHTTGMLAVPVECTDMTVDEETGEPVKQDDTYQLGMMPPSAEVTSANAPYQAAMKARALYDLGADKMAELAKRKALKENPEDLEAAGAAAAAARAKWEASSRPELPAVGVKVKDMVTVPDFTLDPALNDLLFDGADAVVAAMAFATALVRRANRGAPSFSFYLKRDEEGNVLPEIAAVMPVPLARTDNKGFLISAEMLKALEKTSVLRRSAADLLTTELAVDSPDAINPEGLSEEASTKAAAIAKALTSCLTRRGRAEPHLVKQGYKKQSTPAIASTLNHTIGSALTLLADIRPISAMSGKVAVRQRQTMADRAREMDAANSAAIAVTADTFKTVTELTEDLFMAGLGF